MALSIHLKKVTEEENRCVYAFGEADTSVGRVALNKASGDIEVLDLSGTGSPDERFYLAQVVPRLQTYHDHEHYPSHDCWDV